ncbi:MAG: hypothetical protein R2707_13190 [Acidimicrobiales bacterium]
MHGYRNPKLTAMSSAISIVSMLVLLLAVDGVWLPVRVLMAVLLPVAALKTVVALRADRSEVSAFEAKLRRLAFVDRA